MTDTGLGGAWLSHPADPWVNVHWGGDPYRLICIAEIMRLNPEWLLDWVGTFPLRDEAGNVDTSARKTAYTTSEIDNHTVPPPEFAGPENSLPTPLESNNQSWPYGILQEGSIVPALGQIIVGDRLWYPNIGIAMDWRGYTTVQLYPLVNSGAEPPVAFTWQTDIAHPGQKLYFDPRGMPIAKKDIPKDPLLLKGAFVASDQNGTVRITYKNGLVKTNEDDQILWVINPDDYGAPDGCSYDKENKKIIATYLGTGGGEERIDYFNLNGSKNFSIQIGDPNGNFVGESVSRKGKLYGFLYEEGEFGNQYPGIDGYGVDGSLIFHIPPASLLHRDTVFTSITAYGEDHIIVTTFKIADTSFLGPEGFHHASSHVHNDQPHTIRVYNANTGAQISTTDFGHFVADSLSYRMDDNITNFLQADVSDYSHIRAVFQNAYWPSGTLEEPFA